MTENTVDTSEETGTDTPLMDAALDIEHRTEQSTDPESDDTSPESTKPDSESQVDSESEPEPKPELSVDHNGNVVPTPDDVAPTFVAPDDPNAAVFTAATGQRVPASEDSDEIVGTGSAAPAPEEATAAFIATGNRDHLPDETVTEEIPEAPVDVTDEWSSLRADVNDIKAKVEELHALIMEVAPAVRDVTTEVRAHGLMGLMSGMFSQRR